jgi:anthranilate phosphoribosyltransferase
MLSNGVPGLEIAGIMLSSSEFEQDQIEGIYALLLNRAADPIGLAGFMAALRVGVSETEVLATIAASAEYFSKPLESV